MRQITLAILCLVCILLPCRAGSLITADVGERQAAWYGAGHTFVEIKVFQTGRPEPAATAIINYGDSREDVSENYVELFHLPLGWQKIEAPGKEPGSTLILERGQPLTPLPKPGPNDYWFKRHPWLTLLFILLGFYAVFAIGISGGPNHGEHAFILNICHLVGFLFLAKAWNVDYYYTYLIILVVALALSISAVRIRIWDQPTLTWVFKGLMAACYAVLFLIIQSKAYNSYAAWSSADVIQFYVSKPDRGAIQVLGEKERVLAEYSLTSGIDCRGVLFWSEQEQPRALKITSPRGGYSLLVLRKTNPRLDQPQAK
jgi:hypothetical protein